MNYQDIISVDNVFQAWTEFRKGKRKRKDAQEFEFNLEDNLFELYRQLKNKTYCHGGYESFYVHDPKQRHIHKASVRDRVVHHLLYKYLYELFDKTFTYDSYSCRIDKGTHKAVRRLGRFTRRVSRNYTKPCWALKCDIKKFFATVDHMILTDLVKKKVRDDDILLLLKEVITSFSSDYGAGKGIPLGNLTSQIFANIYLSRLDKFVKHGLKVKYYLRYCDDFILLSTDKDYLYSCVDLLKQFVEENLKPELHPGKLTIRKLRQGIDFLGYIVLPHCLLPRTKTKRRMFKRLAKQFSEQSLQSYLGYLGHSNSFKLSQELKNQAYILNPSI